MNSSLKRYVGVALLCLISLSLSYSQDISSGGIAVMIKKGDRFFSNYNYQGALEQYLRAAKLDKKDKSLIFKVAETYVQLHNYQKAEQWYANGVGDGNGVHPDHILHYAQVLRNNESYHEAKKWFEEYDDLVGGNSEAQAQLFFIQNLNYYYKDSARYTVDEVWFNTDKSEFSPAFLGDDLVFLSNRHSRNSTIEDQDVQFDLFKAKLNQTGEAKSAPLPLIDRRKLESSEGPTFFYDNGTKAIFTKTVISRISKAPKLKLFSAELNENGEWDDFDILKLVGEDEVAAYPALTSDGKTLYFSSDIEGGYGKADIYRSDLVNGKWSKPVNMGDLVNSQGSEMFSYLHNDSILYFASDGHPGLGGLDIFKVNIKGDQAKVPVNMGAPINSNKDDFGIVFATNNEEGYFASNRPGGTGSDDLYHFGVTKTKRVVLEGFTKDRADVPINMGHVILYDEVTKEKLGRSDASGYFKLDLENKRPYNLVAKATAKPTTFVIHFEGFVKDTKDTSHALDLVIRDYYTKEPVSKSIVGGYMAFNISEAVDYEMEVGIDGENIDISDIHFEGFVTSTEYPHVNLGEVRIMNANDDVALFKSDKSGFFNFKMQKDKKYNINAQRRGIDEFFELVFEGYIRSKRDTSQIVHLSIFDEDTGEEVYKSESEGYSKFIIEKDRNYKFKARLNDSVEVDMSDIHFEGFVKGLDIPIIISEAKIMDHESQTELFTSDAHGFFSFEMEHDKDYSLIVRKKSNPYKIWFEGFLKNEGDSIAPSDIHIIDPETGRNIFEGYEGYFGFELEEGVTYNIQAEIEEEESYDMASEINFEGFVLEEDIPVSMGQVNVFDAKTNKLLFKSDASGFFEFKADPKEKYQMIARKEGASEDSHDEIKFTGFVKDEADSLTYANFILIDPETGEELTKTDFQGFFSYVLTENKVYDVQAKSIPVRKDVLHHIGLVVIKANDIIKQLVLIESPSGKLYEVNLENKAHYYTDGIITREFSKPIEKDLTSVARIVEFLEEEGLDVVDTVEIKSIYYGTNSYKLLDKYQVELRTLVQLMKEQANVKLVISSHADSRGKADANRILTDKRNQAVINYLGMMGIDSKRIKEISNGEFKSLEHCTDCSEKQNQLNRRTDFHIISY